MCERVAPQRVEESGDEARGESLKRDEDEVAPVLRPCAASARARAVASQSCPPTALRLAPPTLAPPRRLAARPPLHRLPRPITRSSPTLAHPSSSAAACLDSFSRLVAPPRPTATTAARQRQEHQGSVAQRPTRTRRTRARAPPRRATRPVQSSRASTGSSRRCSESLAACFTARSRTRCGGGTTSGLVSRPRDLGSPASVLCSRGRGLRRTTRETSTCPEYPLLSPLLTRSVPLAARKEHRRDRQPRVQARPQDDRAPRPQRRVQPQGPSRPLSRPRPLLSEVHELTRTTSSLPPSLAPAIFWIILFDCTVTTSSVLRRSSCVSASPRRRRSCSRRARSS